MSALPAIEEMLAAAAYCHKSKRQTMRNIITTLKDVPTNELARHGVAVEHLQDSLVIIRIWAAFETWTEDML